MEVLLYRVSSSYTKELISLIDVGGTIAYVYWSPSSLSSVFPNSWMRPMGQMWPECSWLYTILITATTSLHIMLHYRWRWVWNFVFWQPAVSQKQVTCHLNRVLMCKPVHIFPTLCFLLRLLSLETVNECGPKFRSSAIWCRFFNFTRTSQ